jgi:hypothetical protein
MRNFDRGALGHMDRERSGRKPLKNPPEAPWRSCPEITSPPFPRQACRLPQPLAPLDEKSSRWGACLHQPCLAVLTRIQPSASVRIRSRQDDTDRSPRQTRKPLRWRRDDRSPSVSKITSRTCTLAASRTRLVSY